VRPPSKSKLSLRQVLVLPYVVLVLALASVIVGLSYRAGSQAVETVASSLLLETGARIGLAVDQHIMGSSAVLEAAFPEGIKVADLLDIDDLATLRTRFWIATSLRTDPNNYVYYGNKHGQFIGVDRRSGKEAELRLKQNSDEPRKFYRFDGINGIASLKSIENKVYDPRSRPWFKAGQDEAEQTWTSVYIDFSSGDLVATRARRVLGDNGQLEGVVATDMKLKALNDFVSNLKISKNGLALILERNGDLVASSLTDNVTVMPDASKQRVNAAETGNPVISELYSQVKGLFADGKQFEGPKAISFTGTDGQILHASVNQLVGKGGLSWITVVALPRSDFMGSVTNNLKWNAFLAGLAALLAIAIGTRVLGWVVKDLTQLAEAAQKVGEGQIDWPVGTPRSDEIGQLASSFEAMQKRLLSDELTGLANRDAFMLRLRRRAKQASENLAKVPPIDDNFGVLFVDLNQFKRVNDTLGHSYGDLVLVETGKRLLALTTPRDMVARLSGDEFVVLLDVVKGRLALENTRHKIQAALGLPIAGLEGTQLAKENFGGSVGQAIFPDDGTSAMALIKKADRRMYRQKFLRRSIDTGSETSGSETRRESDQPSLVSE
jgi:diguanylate cyclase (GGDEF)-like protein